MDVLPVALREFGIKFDVFWLVPEVVEELIEVLEMEETCGLHQLAVLSIWRQAEDTELSIRVHAQEYVSAGK